MRSGWATSTPRKGARRAVRPLVNDGFLTMTAYVPGKPVGETERELGLADVIKLASNENPLGPSPRALAALRAAMAGVGDYPDGGASLLRRRLARHHGVEPEHLIVGSGSNELIDMIVRTCVRPGENLVLAATSFIAYKMAAQAAGREFREVPQKELRCDLPAMLAALDGRTKLVFLANPNNPTGTYVTRDELAAFLGAVPPEVVVVLDEAYGEYAWAADYPDGRAALARPRTLVLRTFSKVYGLAGLRIGYGLGDAELIDYLNRGRLPFNSNSLAQAAALAALDDPEHVRRSVALNRREMERLVPRLRARGLAVTESQANFVLVDFRRDGMAVFEQLLRQGVIIRPVGNYGLPAHGRITLGTAEQNDRLVAALDRVLDRIPACGAGEAALSRPPSRRPPPATPPARSPQRRPPAPSCPAP